jgi:hypothetical protein
MPPPYAFKPQKEQEPQVEHKAKYFLANTPKPRSAEIRCFHIAASLDKFEEAEIKKRRVSRTDDGNLRHQRAGTQGRA